MSDLAASDRETWVFGYGSLIWRPDFAFEERYPAILRGWKRRFWQGSTDHRGVPGAPGRVVTLLRDPAEQTFGMVHRIGSEELSRVMAALDHREQGGYERFDAEVALVSAPRSSVMATVYVATPENRNYLGPAPLAEIASQILRSRGPSGPNPEYLMELEAALARMNAHDAHVSALADLVRRAQSG